MSQRQISTATTVVIAMHAGEARDALRLVERVLAGDRRALARVLTVLEAGGPQAIETLQALYPHAGRAHVVGLTGPPGSGKSTLAAALARWYRARGERVAILAVDPTSPYTGGALLGDRVRMLALSDDPEVFVRSMAARGAAGGLALASTAASAALDAAGYSRILIETVGVGQGEVAVSHLAHSVVVVTVPGLGDEVQAMKAGLLETADVLVINKADRPSVEQAEAALRMFQSLAVPPGWQPPILRTVALRDEGTEALGEAIEAHGAYLAANPEGGRRAGQRARAAVLAAARASLDRRLQRCAQSPHWAAAFGAVAAHERSPYDVAAELVAKLDLATES